MPCGNIRVDRCVGAHTSAGACMLSRLSTRSRATLSALVRVSRFARADMKYNAVLRAKSGDAFLAKMAKDLCHGNTYVSTIHAINSCVIKLSKLSVAGKVWRGTCFAKLPERFWTPSAEGICGGVEYGFQSMSREYGNAVHYARGCGNAGPEDATTLFELSMGLVDRGADLTWLSQYPHERECLLPPLTGLEAIGSEVRGNLLCIHSRLSLNIAAQTLEQVLSRRRKMLNDMATGIEFELRDTLGDGSLFQVALRILRRSLQYGALSQTPEWFNNDDNFSQVLNEVLYLQRTLLHEVKRLEAAMDKPVLTLQGWKARGPARIMLLAGFVFARATSIDVCIDLRDAELTPTDGEQLARLLDACPKLTSIDVRGNESLGEVGSQALIEFMKRQKASRIVTSSPRSLMGVGGASGPTLTAMKDTPLYECRMLCAELDANVFAEGVSSSMGAGGKKTQGTTLNRRGGHAGDQWQPLIWATKNGNLVVTRQLLDNGVDIDKTEPVQDKGSSAWGPVHWAASKGHQAVLEMLVERGANVLVQDKHGSTARAIAEKKGLKNIVALLEEAERKAQEPSEPASSQNHRRGSMAAAALVATATLALKSTAGGKSKP